MLIEERPPGGGLKILKVPVISKVKAQYRHIQKVVVLKAPKA